MESVIAAIAQYSREIVQKDINAAEVLPYWANNPLPVDRSSLTRNSVLIPQLIKTVGHDYNIFNEHFGNVASHETTTLFCASAASGVGKTHLAYAVGLTGSCVSIIIRIAEHREVNGQAALSTPWHSLIKWLEYFEEYRKTAAKHVQTEVAEHAYNYIKLLILCYVRVTQIALENVSDIVAMHKKCELVLRFHRNCRGEALITDYFKALLAEIQIVDNATGLRVIPCEAINKLVAEAKSISTTPYLLCFDEIPTLLDKYSELFQSHHHTPKYDARMSDIVESTIEQTVVQISKPSALPDKERSRGLFDVVCCAMCDLARETAWCMYMTGTSFSITKFRKIADDYSSVRGRVQLVTLRARFTVQEMVSTLKYYWKLEDSVLNSDEVLRELKYCEGRPLIFVNAVFIPLYRKCVSHNFSGKISASYLVDAIRVGVSDLSREFSVRMDNVLQGEKGFPLDKSRTSRYFLPHLVKALLFDNGKMVLADKLGVEEAIATSLVPVCANHDDRKQEIDITAEPLVFHVLKSVILSHLRTGIHDILKLLIETKLCVGKGDVAEVVIAYNIALLTYQHMILHKGNGIPLADLLMPMFSADRHLLPEQVDHFCSFACRVVDCSDVREECAFRRFIRADGSVDDTIILNNLPKHMGIDIAFIVSDFSDRSDRRVVVAHHKNDTSLSEIMVALNPGLQYLSGTQRQAVLSKERITTQRRACFNASNYGAGHSDWIDYLRFSQAYPWMTQKWFRLAIVAGSIAPEVYTFAPSGIYNSLKLEFRVRRLFRLRKAYMSARAEYRGSPVVFGSLKTFEDCLWQRAQAE